MEGSERFTIADEFQRPRGRKTQYGITPTHASPSPQTRDEGGKERIDTVA